MIGQFERISYEQFEKDVDLNVDKWEMYKNIKPPRRATSGSAGYDFVSPITYRNIEPGDVVLIPTGIRCKIDENYVLLIFVRSSLGFKRQTILVNGTGVIDSDYYNADNEGHIWVKLRNDGDKTFDIEAGDKIVQGVFVPFGKAYETDPPMNVRSGGIGSTD